MPKKPLNLAESNQLINASSSSLINKERMPSLSQYEKNAYKEEVKAVGSLMDQAK